MDAADDLSCVDHLIYGAPDLQAAIVDLEAKFGLRASTGGRHPGEGTHNALYFIGPGRYLEVMAPDPDQPAPKRPRWLGLDDLTEPRLVAWAAKAKDLDEAVSNAATAGVQLGKVLSGSRERPDGTMLRWTLTDPRRQIAGGVVPFLIDWGKSPHPSESAAKGLKLAEFRLEHPDPESVHQALNELGLAIRVSQGDRPALVATLHTPRGTVQLK